MLWKTTRTWLFVLLTCLLAGCAIDNHSRGAVKVEDPFASESEQDFTGLVVTFFALPNGESTLIRLPNGKTMLIDSGSAEDWKTLQALLAERRLTRIDYAVITNDQPEQAGGFPFLTEGMKLETIVFPALLQDSIRTAVPLRADKKLLPVAAGDQLKLDSNVVLTVLHPSEYLFLSPQDNSLVFLLRHDKIRFLFTSAIHVRAEERLLESQAHRLKAEVLKVADQGSNQASSQPFLAKVDPQVAVIQIGKPRDQMKDSQEEVIERLGESWSESYITSQHGTITILSNGKDYRILKGKK
ncbi:ComEC/Rec2 family competence protein [Brevibacillus sp. H7]|uniref:ComEC/Rec2 family competence protein n=1 Tax=Brevibacillus sp. H7 TaxID=3349138 RepID=UPI00382C3BFE